MSEKKIGKVTLDYSFFNSDITYSDGDIEDLLLEAVKEETERKLLESSNKYPVLYHLSPIRENLLDWYPFDKEGTLLEIGSGCGGLTGLFANRVKSVTCIELSEKRSEINAYRHKEKANIRIMLGGFEDITIDEKYDYITLIGVWEYSGLYLSGDDPYLDMLKKIRQYLKKDGKLLIAIENKMGLKYWNGAREDHSFKRFEGINDYPENKSVRTFSKYEITNMLDEVGFASYKFYYPNPDYKLPETIYTDDRLPGPGEIRNYKKEYSENRVYFFSDSAVSDQICYDGMFGYFSNSFLIECGNTELSNIIYTKYNQNRRDEYKTATIISKEKNNIRVRKKSLCEKADSYIYHLKEIERKNGFEIVETEATEGKTLQEIMYNYRNNPDLFIERAKYFLDLFLQSISSKKIPFYNTEGYIRLFGDNYIEGAECFEKTNIDIIFSNLIMNNNGEIISIDREWVVDFPVPYEYPKWRAMIQLYSTYMYALKNYCTRDEFLLRVGIKLDNIKVYKSMDKVLCEHVFGRQYIENYLKKTATVNIEIQ